MRTLTTEESALYDSEIGYSTHLRVEVQDAGGTLRDLSLFAGWDWLVGADIDCDVDQAMMQATVRAKRELFNVSLSPFIQTSLANRTTGTFAPLLKHGRLIRISSQVKPAGTPRTRTVRNLTLTGYSGTYARTPHSSNNNIAGDLDIIADVMLSDWTPSSGQTIVAKRSGLATGISYQLRVNAGGTLSLGWSSDGTNGAGVFLEYASTVPVPATDGTYIMVWVTLDVDDGSGNHVVNFRTSTDGGVTWTALGSTYTTAGVTSIYTGGTQNVEVGAWGNGTNERLRGGVRFVQVKNGQLPRVLFNPGEAPNVGASPFTSSISETWTMFGDARINQEVVDNLSSTGWRDIFQGYISNVSWARNPVVITAFDLGRRLQKAFIKTENDYGSSGGVVLESVMQSILNDHVTSPPTLWTPAGASASAWNLRTFTQGKMPLLEACRNKAHEIGWDVRYAYDEGTGTWRFKLYEPPRSKATVDYTWKPTRYKSVTQLDLGDEDIRNYIAVPFYNSAVLDAKGEWTRQIRTASDATSITENGEMYAELGQDFTSNVNTTTEADRLAASVLSDLKDPIADQVVELPFFHAVDLHDRYTFQADGVRYDTDQTYAVVKYKHHFDQEKQATTVHTRGRPCGTRSYWLEREVRVGVPSSPLVGPGAPTGVVVTTVSGGTKIDYTPPQDPARAAWYETELHLGATGFTPSSTTFVERKRSDNFLLTNLTPGATYYGKLVALDAKGNRSPASAEFSFVAGYTTPEHMQPIIDWSAFPRNGGFEAHNNSSGPPDTWVVGVGTWGTDIVLDTSVVRSGTRSLKFNSSATVASLESQLFPVRPAELFHISIWTKIDIVSGGGSTSNARVQANVRWYSDPTTVILTTNWTARTVNADEDWKHSSRIWGTAVVPSNARFARIVIAKFDQENPNPIPNTIWVDVVQAGTRTTPWLDVSTESVAGFENSWGNLAGYTTQFRITPAGEVEVSGTVTGGLFNNTNIFQFPVGYRPGQVRNLPVATSGGMGIAYVDASGNVRMNAAFGSGWVDLSTMKFLAEQ